MNGPIGLDSLASLDLTSLAWKEQGLCREVDADVFFPERGQPSTEAKEICMMCPVRTECLEYALGRTEHGVWGGTSERQRQKMQGRRVRAHWNRASA